MYSNYNLYYYVHDHLYSPAALQSAGGTVLERYEYDAYGQPTIWDANFQNTRETSNYGNPYLFTASRVDILDSGSLKIQYNRNRYYDYHTGRWYPRKTRSLWDNATYLFVRYIDDERKIDGRLFDPDAISPADFSPTAYNITD